MNETWMVAHDFSPESDLAVEEAARVVARLGGRMVLLHVHPTLQAALGEETFHLEDALRDRLTEMVAALRERHPLLMDVAIDVVPASDAARGILDEAARLDVDHIVVGTHDRRGFEHLILGSVAERVAKRADVPVTIVRQHAAHKSENTTAE